MIYREIKGNLFDVGPEYCLVHCISADFKMGAGIAKTFADLGCREEILKDWDGAYDYWDYGGHIVWTSIPLMASRFPKGVCHLITKKRYFQKPTYDNLRKALIDMRESILFIGEENRHYLYLGDRIKFECPFCCDKPKDKVSGIIYRNRFCEFLDKHGKLCAVIDWFKGYGGDLFFCLLALTGLIFGIWWLIDTDRKLDEKYRYQINVHYAKYSDTYRTNSYTMGDDQEKRMIVMKGDNVTIVDHLNKEDK